jgi:DNA-binding NarL/FixJ family response regulator
MAQVRLRVQTDHRILGEGLRCLLKAVPDLVVTLDNGSPPGQSGGDASDVLLLDAAGPATLERCARLLDENPRPLIIIFGAEADESWAVEALRSGARGVLCKTATIDELGKAIRVVAAGQIWVSRGVIARALDLLSSLPSAHDHVSGHSHPDLTRRENEIVHRAAEGLSNKEIAGRMAISEATVKAHLTNIFRKLSVRDRLQLVILFRDKLGSAPRTATRPVYDLSRTRRDEDRRRRLVAPLPAALSRPRPHEA